MDNRLQLTLVQHFPFFEVLSTEEKIQLAGMMEKRVIPRYGFIYLPGETTEQLFLLAQGSIKIGTHGADGKEIIKQILHPEALFGELGLMGLSEREDFARALKEEVIVYSIKVSKFQQLMERNFSLCTNVMQRLGRRLVTAEHKLESLIFKDARTRIVEFIKESVGRQGRRVGFEMLLRHSLTHQDIANYTCTSRQTVTLVLNELKKSDLIHFNRGRILVRDMERLA
jgi:CRP-like cAMP-binding protein